MQHKLKVSYAICVNNETTSLKLLLNFILKYKDLEDEIVIIDDFSDNKETLIELEKADKVVHRKLANDFASQKNLFFEICSGDYIFNIDADEIPSVKLISDIKTLCIENSNIDVFMIPRENYIRNISKQKLSEWGWVTDFKNRINYPDYQGRIFKNSKKIKWEGCVHERVVGNITQKRLTKDSVYYLSHTKSITKQIKSNKLYQKLKSKNYKFESNFEIGIVCCYFNPCNYMSRFVNYIKFKDLFEKYNIPLLTIESYNKNSKYRINKHTNNLISVKSKSVYWQKETLLNIGIKFLLKTKCKYIMWVDADIIFSSNNWYEKILNSVSFYEVTQIFKTAHQQNFSNGKTRSKKSSAFYINNKSTSTNKLSNLLERKGEPGYGYCYHREVFDNVYLFDKAITGTGDFLNLIGMYYTDSFQSKIKNDRFFKNTTNEFIETYCDWASEFTKQNINLGYVDEEILVMNHGSLENRKYKERESIIKKHNYIPSFDLKINKNGIYDLKNKKLEKSIKKYFKSRNEDENFKNDTALIKNFRKHDISGHDNYYIDKLKYLHDFKINKQDKFIVISSCISKTKIKLNELKTKNKLTLNSSKEPSLYSYILKAPEQKQTGHFLNYIKFIIQFYKTLPEKCIFINSNLSDKNYADEINKILTENTQVDDFKFICDKKELIRTRLSDNIRGKIKFESWWELVTNIKYEDSLTFTRRPSFCISRNLILSKKKSFYKKLIKLIESDNILYEFLLERTFEYIFK